MLSRRQATVATAIALGLALLVPATAQTQEPGVPTQPIPPDPLAAEVPEFIGSGATANPVEVPVPPRHPHMAPNGRSNIHNDAYMTDVYPGRTGPLGPDIQTRSALFSRECASVAFDRSGRVETICVGLEHPVLALLDPHTLEPVAKFDLPPRNPATGDPLSDFSGGGYFYLDNRDRAVIPTTTRHVFVVAQAGGAGNPRFELVRDYDLSGHLALDDGIISVLPDWGGSLWFASRKGVVGTIDPGSGKVTTTKLQGEGISNSFAVDESGGLYIVSDAALYRFDMRPSGKPRVTWREEYEDIGVRKPGQSDAGSGTTPTVMGDRHVAITDNADPMNVLVYERARKVRGSRLACRQPVFEAGASATDQSLIATDTSIITENNYGYTGPRATMDGASTTPGIERVDLEADGQGCHSVWRSDEVAPSAVPKLAAGSGLVFTYTKPPRQDDTDAWYLTAIDFRTGETVYKRLAGTGLGYNNNWSPITIGPDETGYVGVLGGLTNYRDR